MGNGLLSFRNVFEMETRCEWKPFLDIIDKSEKKETFDQDYV